MQYLCLLYGEEPETPEQPTSEEMKEWFDLNDAMKEAGVFVAGEALLPTQTATSVQIRNGKTLTVDGPFAETKEALGGFYLIDAKDLDQALFWAAKIPVARYGTVEVRPVMELPKP